MSKISFIIPAHNCANTIERTVKSIQMLRLDMEIIIVENGSRDDTAEVAGRLAERCSNIHVLSSDQGVSIARNSGMDAASGDWIFFADADDECLQGIESIRDYLNREDLDVIIGSYRKDKDSIIHDYRILNTVTASTDEMKAWLISRPTLRMQAWAKIYRTSFLRDNKLRFNEALSYAEDSEFVIRVLSEARRLLVTNSLFYQYHSGTLSSTRGFTKGRIAKYIAALEAAEADVAGEGAEIKRAFVDYVIAHVNIIGVHDVFGCELKETWGNRCRKMKQVMKETVIERAANGMGFSMSLQSLPVMFCRHHLTVLGGAMYYVRSRQNLRRYKKARIDP